MSWQSRCRFSAKLVGRRRTNAAMEETMLTSGTPGACEDFCRTIDPAGGGYTISGLLRQHHRGTILPRRTE